MMIMMNKEILYKFFGNQASVDEEKQILDWLELDPANRREMLSERKLYDKILMLADDDVLYARPAASKRYLWVREAIKYAAVVLLAVGVGAYYMSSVRKELMMATNTISVPAGQHVNLVLSDGTKVCVNALSTLEYPAFFGGDNRQVKLTGEAFFDVKHDESKPFVVETFACDIQVLGTKFNVTAYPAQNQFITSLVEGSVRLTDRANPRIAVTLSPNQQAAYVDSKIVVSSIPEYEQFQWREGVIAFRDARFMNLIGEFEKYYGVRIEVNRKNISNNLFTGKIRISEGVDHALWVLQQSCKFSYERSESKDVIYIK